MHARARFAVGLLLIAAGGNVLAQQQLVYIPLDQPCRLLDTRTAQGGPGVLTAAHGNYTFGIFNTDIESAAQNGNPSGCSLGGDVSAISVSINQLNATASGNIRAWSADDDPAGPSAGTAVYNPTVPHPAGGQVLYNGAYATITLSSLNTGRKFFLSVANGQLDMTINVVGYWEAVGTGNNAGAAAGAVAFGTGNDSVGNSSMALGKDNSAAGDSSVAIGTQNTTFATNAVAIGFDNTSNAVNTIVMGYYAYAPANAVNSFVFNDGSSNPQGGPSSPHLFWARATNGFQFYTSANMGSGAQLAAGSGSWTALSDRNAKTAVQRIDGRDVLDRVVAMPLATWQYKTQDAKYRHMGPMAQDFYVAFGLGESDTGIDTIDADGVALAAIQGLNAKLESKLDAERAEHADALAERDRQIAELRAQVAELAAAIRHPAGN